MVIVLDLTRLYFALRSLNRAIDYSELLMILREHVRSLHPRGNSYVAGSVQIIAFTMEGRKNLAQAKFLGNLEAQGVRIYREEFEASNRDVSDGYSIEIAAMLGASLLDSRVPRLAVVVSDCPRLIWPISLLKERGVKVTVAFFAEALAGKWIPRILSKEVDFLDLSPILPVNP